MDDPQLETELAALEGTPAAESEQSEAQTETPEGEEAEAETETTDGTDDADDAGEDAGEEGDDAETDEDNPPKPKKLSGSARKARELERLRRENAELRSRAPSGAQSESDVAREVEKIIGKPPNEKDFEGDYLKYERALTVYEMRKANAEDRVKEAGTRQQAVEAERRRAAVEAHQDRVEEFREKAKDFDTVLKGAADLKASPVVEDLVLESDKSAHLVYYLAKNPQRLQALNGMTERQAAREIGRIESRLSLPQPKTATKAPKPVTPPKGGAAPSSPDKDIDAYIAKTYGKK